MPRDLWEIGSNLAKNKTLGKRIRHSKFADPFRRKSGARIGQMAVKTAVSAVPIPVVRHLLDGAVSKGLALARRYRKDYKLSDKHPGDVEKAVKWGWKDLSVEEMDRYRWKIHHASKVLDQAVQIANQEHSASVCNDCARAISKYVYLKSRIEKMREKVLVLEVLIKDTKSWLDDVDNNLSNSEVEGQLRNKAISIQNNVEEDSDDHSHCDETLCILGSKERWVDKHKTLGKVAQVTTSFVVDIAPNPALTTTLTEGYYKSANAEE